MRARFLNGEERQGTREFYESAFPEDPKGFVDFYYDWIVRRNDIFAAGQWEGEAYQVQAMMHINEHNFSVNGFHRAAPYFVAVATRPECRKQGKMRDMMAQAMQDMCRRQYPFAFLMPANPAYYISLGFRYFPEQPGVWQSNAPIHGSGAGKTEALDRLLQGMAWRQPSPQDIPRMCAFANQTLGQGYQIAIRWDEPYCRRLFAETSAEQGGVLLLESQSALQGILAYGISMENGGKKTAEVKDLILDGGLLRHQESLCHAALPGCDVTFLPMEMMVRILCLSAFVPLLKSPVPKTFHADIEDPIIPSNCGCFEIALTPEGGRINPVQRTGAEQKINIAELALILLKDVPAYITEWV